MGVYLRPNDLGDALEALKNRELTVLAGGTDFYPRYVTKPIDVDVLDITDISELSGINSLADCWRIGAAVTWSNIISEDLPPFFDGLKDAAREVGGQQIQNVGTIVGNLCNASPAADGIPPLMALDAKIELSGFGIKRVLPINDFVLGNRETARRDNELVTAVIVPKGDKDQRSAFLKLGTRRYLVISIVMVAGWLSIGDDGLISGARIVVGACSEIACRIKHLEEDLIGVPIDSDLSLALKGTNLRELRPIDDCRGTAEYRNNAAIIMLRRLLKKLGGELQ